MTRMSPFVCSCGHHLLQVDGVIQVKLRCMNALQQKQALLPLIAWRNNREKHRCFHRLVTGLSRMHWLQHCKPRHPSAAKSKIHRKSSRHFAIPGALSLAWWDRNILGTKNGHRMSSVIKGTKIPKILENQSTWRTLQGSLWWTWWEVHWNEHEGPEGIHINTLPCYVHPHA